METEYQSVNESENKSWVPFLRQLMVASVVWGSFIVGGMSMGSPTVVVPQLRKEANSTEAVSSEMASWLASIGGYSGTLCVFIIIPTAHFFGRKPVLIILSLSKFISSTIIYLGKNATHILISQAFNGFSIAAHVSICLLVISEYSSPKYRGLFLTLKSATFFWGIWIANAIGIFTHYKYIGLVGLVISVVSLIFSFIVPESPYWLAFNGRYDECAVAHRWLRGNSEDSGKELAILIETEKVSCKSKKSSKSLAKYIEKYLAALKQPDIFKPILLCFLTFSCYHFSGKLVCAIYAIEMMKKMSQNQTTVLNGVLILDGFTVFGMYLGSAVSRSLKRRTLLLTTSITGTIFLFAMSFYLYLIKFSILPENPYVIIAMLVGYSIAICCGPIILAVNISGELLPMRYRSFCVFIFAIYCTMLVGFIVKVSPYVFNSVGFQGAYLGFGICMSIIITLIYKFLPETKDKTLYEIAAIFKSQESYEATQSIQLLSNPSETDTNVKNV